MNVHIKTSGSLYEEILGDLTRQHPFADERVGFVFGRADGTSEGQALLLLTRYHSIPDEQYVPDDQVSARIGRDAMAWTMTAVHEGRRRREGLFHIHLHDHIGPTLPSKVDAIELPRMIPGFRSVNAEAPHGIIILSLDHGSGWVWLPGSEEPVRAQQISVVGVPVLVFETESGT